MAYSIGMKGDSRRWRKHEEKNFAISWIPYPSAAASKSILGRDWNAILFSLLFFTKIHSVKKPKAKTKVKKLKKVQTCRDVIINITIALMNDDLYFYWSCWADVSITQSSPSSILTFGDKQTVRLTLFLFFLIIFA